MEECMTEKALGLMRKTDTVCKDLVFERFRPHPNRAVGGVLENSALLVPGHVTDHVVSGVPDAHRFLLQHLHLQIILSHLKHLNHLIYLACDAHF